MVIRIPHPQEQAGPTRSHEFSAPATRPMVDAAPGQLEALGRATEQTGLQAQAIGQHLQDSEDDARAGEADNQYRERINARLYEPGSGFLHQVGKAAVDQREQVLEQLKKEQEAIEKGLPTEVSRNVFRIRTDAQMADVQRQVAAHAGQQLQVYEAGQEKARIPIATTAAVAAFQPQDMGRTVPGSSPFREQARSAVRAAEDYARLTGMPPAERELLLQQTMSGIHAGVVQRLVNEGKADKGREYLAMMKEHAGHELTLDARERLEDLVRHGSITERATDLALELSGKGASLEDQVTKLTAKRERKEITADVFQATRAELARIDDMNRQARANRGVEVLTEAQRILSSQRLLSPSQLPADLQTDIGKLGLIDDVNRFASHGRRVTDNEAFVEVLNAPREALRQLSPAEFHVRYWGKLSEQDWQTARALHADSYDVQDPKLTELFSIEEQVKSGARSLGINVDSGAMGSSSEVPSDYRTKTFGADAFMRYRGALQRRLNAFEVSLGGKRKATGEERQKVIDDFALDTVSLDIPGVIDPVVPAGLLTTKALEHAYVTVDSSTAPPAGDVLARMGITKPAYVTFGREEVRVASVPALQRSKIIEALDAEGLPVTEKAIVEAWVAAGKPGKPAPLNK